MRKIIDMILRNGVSAGPQQKTVLHLPVNADIRKVFNTDFRTNDNISVETDGINVAVTIFDGNTVIQEDLDRGISARLADYLSFGGIALASAITKDIN